MVVSVVFNRNGVKLAIGAVNLGVFTEASEVGFGCMPLDFALTEGASHIYVDTFGSNVPD